MEIMCNADEQIKNNENIMIVKRNYLTLGVGKGNSEIKLMMNTNISQT